MSIVDIYDLNSEGNGVGDLDGKKVFVEGALPGERVEVSIHSSKKSYDLAKIVSIETESKDRIEPVCPLFGTCGGCQIMHLEYKEQLNWKKERVQSTLKRIAGIDIEVAPCVPSPLELRYRNKAHFHKGGFYKKGTHETIEVKKCYLVREEIEQAIPEKQVDDLLIKYSKYTNSTLVVKNGISNKKEIIEKIGNLKFKIKPKDFFQVNIEQTLNLYKKALEIASVAANKKVLDAYCGVGTLALLAAKKAKKVVGIEIGKTAIESAKENAILNDISNVTFVQGKVETKLECLRDIDIAFINPPRSGLSKEVLDKLISCSIEKLIYISCDPATLSRDLKVLKDTYKVLEVHPFDMFPQTTHVETIVSLKLI